MTAALADAVEEVTVIGELPLFNLEKLELGFEGKPAGMFAKVTAAVYRAKVVGGWLVVSAGAKTRWANIFVGILIAFIILLLADLVKLIAMPALAGLLIVVGFQTIKPEAIQTVWLTGICPAR